MFNIYITDLSDKDIYKEGKKIQFFYDTVETHRTIIDRDKERIQIKKIYGLDLKKSFFGLKPGF